MPQDVEAYLRSLKTSDRVRAAAWDAVYTAKDDADAEARLRQLPLDDDARAFLFDARTPPLTAPAAAPLEEPRSATRRFIGGAAEMLNPVTMAKGAYQAARHPIDTAGALIQAQGEQFWKAGESFTAAVQEGSPGRIVEGLGHGAAGLLPVLGPVAANIGEQIGGGDVAGGLGAAAGLLTPMAAARPVAAAARGAGRRIAPALQASAERRVVQALGPTKERFKAMAEKRAPEILERGLGGSRATLQAQSAEHVQQVGRKIDAVLEQHGGNTVNPQPIIDALEQAKGAYQTTRRMPLTDAVAEGLEQTPGARVVGDVLELPVIHEPRAVAQLSTLQKVITDLGPEARVDQIVAIRRAWDKVVADAGGFGHRAPGGIGQPLKDVSEAAAKRQATTAIRKVLDDEVPDLSAINKEFGFWKDLDSVLRQTMQRTRAQGSGLGSTVREGAGGVAGAVFGSAGGPVGAGAGALLGGALAKTAHAVFTSPRWRLVSARSRSQLAEALASGNPERISTALGRVAAVTGGGTAVRRATAMTAEDPTDTPATVGRR